MQSYSSVELILKLNSQEGDCWIKDHEYFHGFWYKSMYFFYISEKVHLVVKLNFYLLTLFSGQMGLAAHPELLGREEEPEATVPGCVGFFSAQEWSSEVWYRVLMKEREGNGRNWKRHEGISTYQVFPTQSQIQNLIKVSNPPQEILVPSS